MQQALLLTNTTVPQAPVCLAKTLGHYCARNRLKLYSLYALNLSLAPASGLQLAGYHFFPCNMHSAFKGLAFKSRTRSWALQVSETPWSMKSRRIFCCNVWQENAHWVVLPLAGMEPFSKLLGLIYGAGALLQEDLSGVQFPSRNRFACSH